MLVRASTVKLATGAAFVAEAPATVPTGVGVMPSSCAGKSTAGVSVGFGCATALAVAAAPGEVDGPPQAATIRNTTRANILRE